MLKNLNQCLIDEWAKAWKLWSVQLNALGLALMGLAELLRDSAGMVPPSLIQFLPHAQAIAMVLFVAGLIARILKQPTKGD